jgi:hypothetical protein
MFDTFGDSHRRSLDSDDLSPLARLFLATSPPAAGVVRRRGWRLMPALFVTLALLTGGLLADRPTAKPPTPASVLAFEPGEDYRLADFRQLREYFRRLDDASDRVRLFVAGRSTGGREILVAAVSSEANLAQLERHRDTARRLAGARPSESQARALARDGKAIVWIDSGLHASEVATAQHALVLAHQVATSESADMRAIRENVILMLLPCINPDGMELVVDWYRRHVGTPYQDSPLPRLYHEYVGHDNNRDFFMQTQRETQVLNRLLYFDWLPQVMYNHHQGLWPTRMFVPPFPEPVNPHIDPQVMRGVDDIGEAIQRRLAAENKDGVISRYAFSAWYNGSIRTTGYFHNIIGILTETGHASATPHRYDASTFPRELARGVPALAPSPTYPNPWTGGVLRLRDAMEYMLTGSLAVLEFAARHRERLLYGVYETGRRQVEKGRDEPPFAYLIPADQHDVSAARAFLSVLVKGAVEVHRADASFTADGQAYAAGTHVVLLAQPFRPFVRDLVEPHRYPDLRGSPREPPVPPYDTAGWTLSYQMGVRVVAVTTAFDTSGLIRLDAPPLTTGPSAAEPGAAWGYALHPADNAAFIAVNRLLARRIPVRRTTKPFRPRESVTLPAGAWIVPGRHAAALASGLGLRAWGLAKAPDVPLVTMRPGRFGLYKSFVANIDEGWTRWLAEQYGFPYVTLTNRDVQRGDLHRAFDVVLLPDQTAEGILHGHQPGDEPPRPGPWGPVPPEYQGGIGEGGLEALKSFVRAGGTIIAFDNAAELPLTRFGGVFARIRDSTRGLDREAFYCPGSVVRIEVDGTHPAGWGMEPESAAFFQRSRAFLSADGRPRSIARYAGPGRVLLSGWLLGERHIAGRHAVLDVPYGRGRVVLFGFRPQFRAQPHATFKLLFNLLLERGRSS